LAKAKTVSTLVGAVFLFSNKQMFISQAFVALAIVLASHSFTVEAKVSFQQPMYSLQALLLKHKKSRFTCNRLWN
jgi:hypothetical protein